ncbi:hypothetical protein NQ314_003049 [Rhamnusium bicolor]|uniref:Uncharacterized protein n=1 Tax=Rhamnusium bicolor TaxID=1586634 RepID=A0AAV8ZMP3_9CUCU|nr:hypothetical protein NQ314_003049 [Rhamnusium bicolor]
MREFPGLKFHRPRIDTCNLCDKLNCKIRAKVESSDSPKTKLDLHHQKSEEAQKLLRQRFFSSQEAGSNICSLSMDLEQSIEQRFLVSGHSFMPCDLDFALVEKRKRVMNVFVPDDLINVIESSRYSPPLKVFNMSNIGFWNIKDTADTFLNTTNLKIGKAVAIRIEKNNPTAIKSKKVYSEMLPWVQRDVLKRGKTLDSLRKVELKKLDLDSKISNNKKKSLRAKIDFLSNPEHKKFYRNF